MKHDDNIDDNINDYKKDQQVYDEMDESEDISLQQILVSLISDKKNLTLKTEIHNPKALASLYVLKEYFKTIECKQTAKLIDSFIAIYLEYMVSYNRKSRKEVIKAVSSWIEKEQSMRLTTNKVE